MGKLIKRLVHRFRYRFDKGYKQSYIARIQPLVTLEALRILRDKLPIGGEVFATIGDKSATVFIKKPPRYVVR